MQAAVAVRSAPGSSMLKDVALLHAGDTFGELCLLVGSTKHGLLAHMAFSTAGETASQPWQHTALGMHYSNSADWQHLSGAWGQAYTTGCLLHAGQRAASSICCCAQPAANWADSQCTSSSSSNAGCTPAGANQMLPTPIAHQLYGRLNGAYVCKQAQKVYVLTEPRLSRIITYNANLQAQGRASMAKGSNGAPTEAALVQRDAVSVDALYQMIGQPRGQPQAQLKPAQADQVRQLYSRQLQEAAAAEAATVGTWQQLPHERLSSAGPSGRPATASRRRPAAAPAPAAAQHAGERDVYEVRIGDVLAIGSMAGAAQEPVQHDTAGAQHRLDSGELDIQQDVEEGTGTAGPAQQQQLEGHEQQSQQTNRSPLMHHAAIMHFAALRAAAAGHPS